NILDRFLSAPMIGRSLWISTGELGAKRANSQKRTANSFYGHFRLAQENRRPGPQTGGSAQRARCRSSRNRTAETQYRPAHLRTWPRARGDRQRAEQQQRSIRR